MKFAYSLTGTGWSDAKLSADGQVVKLSASYLSDALGNLLAAVWCILDGDDEARCSWDEEPGEYRWLFERRGSDVRVTILSFEELWGDKPDGEGKSLFDVSVPVSELGQAISRAAHQVLKKHGPDGYRAKWVEHDFPIETLQEIDGILERLSSH